MLIRGFVLCRAESHVLRHHGCPPNHASSIPAHRQGFSVRFSLSLSASLIGCYVTCALDMIWLCGVPLRSRSSPSSCGHSCTAAWWTGLRWTGNSRCGEELSMSFGLSLGLGDLLFTSTRYSVSWLDIFSKVFAWVCVTNVPIVNHRHHVFTNLVEALSLFTLNFESLPVEVHWFSMTWSEF